MGYFVASFLAAYDKRGKEVYFDEDPTEVTFDYGMYMHAIHPTWKLRTDDWGWIYRSHGLAQDGSEYWKEYDVFIAILVTGPILSFFWLLYGILALYKYLASKVHLATIVWTLANE